VTAQLVQGVPGWMIVDAAKKDASIGLVVVAGMTIGTLFTLFVLPAVYVVLATNHRASAESQRTREIADFDRETGDFDLAPKALKPT